MLASDEDRGRAEVRRVGVRDLEVGGEVETSGPELGDPHEGERAGKGDERHDQRLRQPTCNRRPGDDRHETGEGQEEEEQLDGSASHIAGPEHRQCREADEGGGRQGQHARDLDEPRAAESDVRERERRSGKNGIERKQQERLLAPDLHRNAERDRDESRHRNNRGIPDEEDGQGGQRERDCAHGGQPGR